MGLFSFMLSKGSSTMVKDWNKVTGSSAEDSASQTNVKEQKPLSYREVKPALRSLSETFLDELRDTMRTHVQLAKSSPDPEKRENNAQAVKALESIGKDVKKFLHDTDPSIKQAAEVAKDVGAEPAAEPPKLF